jgi:hypothetical protein
MPFDDSACFRLDRIPIRPIHRPWRPDMACAKSHLAADLAARHRTTPMRVRPTDPCRAVSVLRPYQGLTQRRKGAKKSRLPKAFLCAFAPLRESLLRSRLGISTNR